MFKIKPANSEKGVVGGRGGLGRGGRGWGRGGGGGVAGVGVASVREDGRDRC